MSTTSSHYFFPSRSRDTASGRRIGAAVAAVLGVIILASILSPASFYIDSTLVAVP